MIFTGPNYPSPTLGAPPGAPSQRSQCASNHDTYGDGKYYAHQTPQRASNAAPPPVGQYFFQGQAVQVQAPGTSTILNTFVLRDATPYDQVLVEINGRAYPIPNNSHFIW